MTRRILSNGFDKSFGLNSYTIFIASLSNSKLSYGYSGLIDGERLNRKGDLQ